MRRRLGPASLSFPRRWPNAEAGRDRVHRRFDSLPVRSLLAHLNRFFLEPDVQKRIAIIKADPTGWATNATLFAAGAAVAGFGFVFLAWHLLLSSRDLATRFLAILAVGAGGAGAVFGLVNYYAGAVRTPEEFASGTVTWTGLRLRRRDATRVVDDRVATATAGISPMVRLDGTRPDRTHRDILVLVRNFPPLLFYMITVFIGIVLLLIPTVDRGSGRMENDAQLVSETRRPPLLRDPVPAGPASAPRRARASCAALLSHSAILASAVSGGCAVRRSGGWRGARTGPEQALYETEPPVFVPSWITLRVGGVGVEGRMAPNPGEHGTRRVARAEGPHPPTTGPPRQVPSRVWGLPVLLESRPAAPLLGDPVPARLPVRGAALDRELAEVERSDRIHRPLRRQGLLN